MERVEIRLREEIDEHWSDWLNGLVIQYTDQHETVLTGCVADQAALYGVLIKLRDLSLSLVSVNVLAAVDHETATQQQQECSE